MLYFAYGSNMDWTQMHERCTSARFVGIAMLPDHNLAFTRKSANRGCGVADAVAEEGQNVWGVVYEIADPDVNKLDAIEGYRPGRVKNSYWRRECFVLLDGKGEQPRAAWTYFAEKELNPPLPSVAYKKLIVNGAQYWHLPNDYVRQLEQIEAI